MIREKSILRAPPKVGKKETKQNNHHSTTKKSQPKKPYFYHYCGALGTLIQIAISGQPLNKAIVCHLLETKINSNFPQPLLENFLRLSCYSLISIDLTLLLIHLNKGSCKRKIPHIGLPSGRKKIPSDSFTFLIS